MGDEADALEDQAAFHVGVSCERCGADGFHWEETFRGWRLFDDLNQLHSCGKRHENGSEVPCGGGGDG